MHIKNQIKIIRVIARLNIGGPAIHTCLLTKYLSNENYSSLLISGELSEGEGDMSYLLGDSESNHIHIPTLQREISPLADLKSIIKLYKIFRKEKPDIVHTHTAKAGMVGRFAAFLAGVPVRIHTYHGHVFSGYFSRIKTLIFIWIEKLLAFLSTRIIVISEKQKSDICNKYKIASEKKVSLIPLGFDLENFSSIESNKNHWRKKFNIPDDAPIIAIIGRLTAIKNHQLFLDIAKEINKKISSAHYLIIGDGELYSEIQKKVIELELGANVHFTGWVKELSLLYSDIDILTLTSSNEGTPVAIIEAMFYHIPVVSTKVGGVPDLINNGENGFFINSINSKDFTDIIVKLLKNEKLRKKIGEAGNRFVKERFSAKRLITDIDRLYQRLINDIQ